MILIDQVVEEFREELGQPPHTDQVPPTRVVSPLPAALLALITLFLVILTVKLDDLTSDFFVDHAVESQTFVFLQRRDHKSLVLLHDCRLLSHVCH